MSPEEIIDAYNVVAQDVKNNAANNAAAIGNSQRSIGTYASNVASPSGQTNGLANYTYNRVMRPTVDTKAAALTTAGKSAALERLLQTQLLAAKGAYEDAKNAYSLASTNYTTAINSQNSSNGNNVEYTTDNQYTGEEYEEPETMNTDQVVTGTSALPWGNGAGGYIMIGTPWGGEGSPGKYFFQDKDGNSFYMDLPEGHEFVVDTSTGNLVTRQKQ